MKKSILIIVITLALTSCQTTVTHDLLITDVNIIDVETGEVLPNRYVGIDGETITKIYDKPVKAKTGTQVVDAAGKYLIPGLWDMHVHNWWSYQDSHPLLIAHGVTGIREMFGNMDEVKKIRQLIATDSITGPDIISAAALVDGSQAYWPGSDIADTPEKGREIVGKQKAAGADFVKVYSWLERDVYFAIADECKKQNIPFDGHIPVRITLQEALEAGHGSLEHFLGISEFCSAEYAHLMQVVKRVFEKDTIMSFYDFKALQHDTYDPAREPALFELIEKHKPWICPTLTTHIGSLRNVDADYPYDKRIDYMPPYSLSGWKTKPEDKRDSVSKRDLQSGTGHYKIMEQLLKPLKTHGARFLAGTDFPVHYSFAGFSLHEEMELFVEAGFSPLEALQTATLNPALFLGIENETGTVDNGKRANLVLLDANPLDDIKNTTQINAVILRGKYHQGSELREKIEAIAAHNRKPKIKDEMLPIILNEGIDPAIDKYRELKTGKPDVYNFDENQLNSFGYTLLGENRNADAVKIFELNVEIFPDYANGFDSLGDGYMATGDKQKAKEAWQKAVELGFTASKDKLEALE